MFQVEKVNVCYEHSNRGVYGAAIALVPEMMIDEVHADLEQQGFLAR
jgi:5-keto 4-deoxyuronate isomerase